MNEGRIPIALTPDDRIASGARTGNGFEGAGCPSCGTVFRVPAVDPDALFNCTCGTSFDLRSLTRPRRAMETLIEHSGAAIAAPGPGKPGPGAPPTLEEDGPPDLEAVRAEIETGTRVETSATTAGAETLAPVSDPSDPTKNFGKYEIVEEIARGGMGVVYRARQKGLKREVALKMLLAGEGASEEQIRRFLREAESAARLSHPGIVPIYDVGEIDGKHYYTMEFIEGESVGQVIDRMGMIPPRQALKIARDVAVALAFAHENQILHRDIKPANVMLAPREGKSTAPESESVAFRSGVTGTYRVLVADFGLAKDMGGDSVLTLSGTALGTPVYMPPEQADGNLQAMGPHSDVYSLGAVLYEMITGHEPFEGTSVGQILTQVITRDPVPPRKRLPGLHRDVETIVLTAMAKEPNRRYDSARHMADDIDRYLKGEAISARPASIAYRMAKKVRRNKLVSALAFLFLLTLIAGGLFLRAESIRHTRETRVNALSRIVEGNLLLMKGEHLDAEKAFESALAVLPSFRAAEEGMQRARLARVLKNAGELLDEKNWKAAGMVLQEAFRIGPQDRRVLELDRTQKGTASLAVRSEETGWHAWFVPNRPGVLLMPEILPGLEAWRESGLLEDLGPVPCGPSDRPFGDGYLLLSRGDDIVSVHYLSIPRSADVSLNRSTLRVDPSGAGDYDDLGKALAAAGPGSDILLAPGVYEGNWTVSIAGLHIRGSGDERPVLRAVEKTHTLLFKNAPGTCVRGIDIDAENGGGIKLENCPGSRILDVEATGGPVGHFALMNSACSILAGCSSKSGKQPAAVFANSPDSIAVNNHVDVCGWVGLYIGGGSHRCLVARNHVERAQRMGIFVQNNVGSRILENVVHTSDQWGILVAEGTRDTDVIGNFVDSIMRPKNSKITSFGINYQGTNGGGLCAHNTVLRSLIGISISFSLRTRLLDSLSAHNYMGLHFQNGGPVDHCCLFGNRIFARWIEKDCMNLEELQEVFNWRVEKMMNGLESDPKFTDPKKGDFSLAPDSPCRGAASDGGDIGADWDVVKAVKARRFDLFPWLKAAYADRFSALAEAASDDAKKTEFLRQALLFRPDDAALNARLEALSPR